MSPSGRCEIIFNHSLYEASVYGGCGTGRGQFREPSGIVADEDGNVFVTDTGNDRVVHLRYQNDTLRWMGEFGSAGEGRDTLSDPTAIALGASGALYICDSGNDRIVIMSQDGERLGTIGGEGGIDLRDIAGIAVVEEGDPWIARDRAFAVISDLDGRRLSRTTTSGELELSIEASELPVDGATFGALAIDFYGNVYALDRAGARVHKFDRELRYVTSVGESGTDDGQFDDPRDLTLYRRFGQIFVTERSGAQYLWIGGWTRRWCCRWARPSR